MKPGRPAEYVVWAESRCGDGQGLHRVSVSGVDQARSRTFADRALDRYLDHKGGWPFRAGCTDARILRRGHA